MGVPIASRLLRKHNSFPDVSNLRLQEDICMFLQQLKALQNLQTMKIFEKPQPKDSHARGPCTGHR